MNPFILLVTSALFFLSCQKEIADSISSSSPFESIPVTVPIPPGIMDEASGMADSKKNTGYLWVQQDSGNPAELTLLSYQGMVQKKIFLKGINNRDWEDMAIGTGPLAGENYLYLAEIGDNNAIYPDYSIFRFIEPSQSSDTVFAIDNITFQYPDGSHDAEAILLDNETNDIFIITKRDSLSKIYKLPYPQSISLPNQAIYAGTMTVSGITSACSSPDGKELLVKNYTNVFYWKRNTGESILAALQRNPLIIGYAVEPQGEAICFKNDNTAFYTVSEKPFFATAVTLNLYKRK